MPRKRKENTAEDYRDALRRAAAAVADAMLEEEHERNATVPRETEPASLKKINGSACRPL
jgi:hypothetical protein